MILGLLAALAAQQNIETSVPTSRIDIPDPIAPAIWPYMQCTNQHGNADPRMPSSDPAELRVIQADAISACAEVRRRSFQRADRILRRGRDHRDTTARRALINSVLDQIDRSVEGLIAALANLNATNPPAAAKE